MTIQLSRTLALNYQPVNGYSTHTGKINLRFISSNKLDQSRAVAAKSAFNTSLERALLSQKYWNELLEKLRKGGGGSGSSSFDRVTVSMQLMNFLSNKIIQAILRNFSGELVNLGNNFTNYANDLNQNIFSSIAKNISTFIFNGLSFSMLNLTRNLSFQSIPKAVTNFTHQLAGILSFQLTKLKEILEEKLNETIRKLDVKEKIKQLKAVGLDLFLELREELLELVNSVTFYLGNITEKFLRISSYTNHS